MLILIALSTLIIVYTLHYYLRYRTRYPLGPFPLPFIGNTYHINPNNFHRYLDQLGKSYGGCFTLFLPAPTVILTDFRYINEALLVQGDKFAGRTHRIPEILLQRKPNTGIIISDGPVWKAQRRATLKILRYFGLGGRMMEEKIFRSIEQLLDSLEKSAQTPIDLEKPLQLCVGNVINDFLFGRRFLKDDSNELFRFIAIIKRHLQRISTNPCTLLCQAFPWAVHLPIIGYYGCQRHKENIEEYISYIEQQVDGMVESYTADKEPENFVHAYRKEMETDSELNLPNLRAISTDFWLAGMESTATCIRWLIAHMIHYPDIQSKIHGELLLACAGREIEYSDRNNLPYTMAAINEVHRRANMNPFLNFHVCTETTEIFGRRIERGTTVMAQIWSVLNDPKIFEEPLVLRPERFLDDQGRLEKTKLEKNITFGIGKRACVGEGLARLQIFLIFINLIKRYQFIAGEELPDLEPEFATVLAPKTFLCRLQPWE